MAARYVNDAEIAKAQRDFELKKAAYDVEVFSKKAESDLSYNLQAAKTRQRIKDEQMQVRPHPWLYHSLFRAIYRSYSIGDRGGGVEPLPYSALTEYTVVLYYRS